MYSSSEVHSTVVELNLNTLGLKPRHGNPIHPGKRFVIPLVDEFTLEGPSRHHRCLVFPVALNSVAVAKEVSVSYLHVPCPSSAEHCYLVITGYVTYPLIRDGTRWYVSPSNPRHMPLLTVIDTQIFIPKTSSSKRHRPVMATLGTL